MDKTFGIIYVITLALIYTCHSQKTFGQESADEIKDELKKLLEQEAQIYESKLKLLQQLQNLQQEVINIPTTTTTTTTTTMRTVFQPPPPYVPVTFTTTKISEQQQPHVNKSSTTPIHIITSSSTTSTSSSSTTSSLKAPKILERHSTTRSISTTGQPSSPSSSTSTNSKSVSNSVSYSEVRVDSPSILILKGKKSVLVRE